MSNKIWRLPSVCTQGQSPQQPIAVRCGERSDGGEHKTELPGVATYLRVASEFAGRLRTEEEQGHSSRSAQLAWEPGLCPKGTGGAWKDLKQEEMAYELRVLSEC